MNWKKLGKCYIEKKPISFFHPAGESGPHFNQKNPNKIKRDKEMMQLEHARYCIGCPVINECLEYALEMLSEGVAGGKTETERKLIIRRRQRAATKAARLAA